LFLELIDIVPVVLIQVDMILVTRITRQQHADKLTLVRDLDEARTQSERCRSEARLYFDGHGMTIDNEFARWGLAVADREVALLLIKGFSHKEIGEIQGVSERTVLEQARAVYTKSGLSGRATLSAHFLKDVSLPRADTPITDAPQMPPVRLKCKGRE